MALTIQYITDSRGRKKSAIVPIRKWEELNAVNQQLNRKIELLTGIVAGVEEVKQPRANGIPLQSLSDFLNEFSFRVAENFKKEAKPLF